MKLLALYVAILAVLTAAAWLATDQLLHIATVQAGL